MIVVPPEFAADRIRRSGEAGKRWLADLPPLVESLCERWGVELTGEAPSYGVWGIVMLGCRRGSEPPGGEPSGGEPRGGEPCALKVSWPEHRTGVEAAALRAWNGHGAVRLLEASPADNALLLERLDPRRTLEQLDLIRAAELAGGIIRQLAIHPPAGFPAPNDGDAEVLADGFAARQAELDNPLPAKFVDLAIGLGRDLASTRATVLVHTDLHYGNILAGGREPWLAIDPRPLIGDAEQSVPELMWWRLDEAERDADVRTLLATLVAGGDLDLDRATAWTLVRAVDYWLWGLANGLTEDPVRCERLLETLGP